MEVLASLLLYLLFSIGVSHMWSHAEVFTYARNKIVKVPYVRRALLCAECASFWIGLATAFIYNPIIHVPILCGVVVTPILLGIVTHLFSSFLYKKEYLT